MGWGHAGPGRTMAPQNRPRRSAGLPGGQSPIEPAPRPVPPHRPHKAPACLGTPRDRASRSGSDAPAIGASKMLVPRLSPGTTGGGPAAPRLYRGDPGDRGCAPTQRPRVGDAAGAASPAGTEPRARGGGVFGGGEGGGRLPRPRTYHGEGSGSGAAAGAERRGGEAALGRPRPRPLS